MKIFIAIVAAVAVFLVANTAVSQSGVNPNLMGNSQPFTPTAPGTFAMPMPPDVSGTGVIGMQPPRGRFGPQRTGGSQSYFVAPGVVNRIAPGSVVNNSA